MRLSGLRTLAASIALLPAAVAHAQPGDIDPTFGNKGALYARWTPVVAADGSLRLLDFWSSEGGAFPGGTTTQTHYLADSGGALPAGTSVLLDRIRYGHVRNPLILAQDGAVLAATSPLNASLYGGGSRATSSRAGVLKLAPDGNPVAQFGIDGVAWLPVESFPIRTGSYRSAAAIVEMTDGRIVVAVADSCAVASATGPEFQGDSISYGANDDSAWGLPLNGQICYVSRRLEQALALARLLPDGRADTTFGTGGLVRLDALGEVALLGVQADGAIVLADRQGHVRRYDPDGSRIAGRDVELQEVSGFMLGDGSLFLAGRSLQAGGQLSVIRLEADLSPLVTQGTAFVPGFDLGKIALGRDGTQVQVVDAVGSTDGLQAYVAINLMTATTRDYLCGGILRLNLAGEVSVDSAFGASGFSCIARGGFTAGETHLVLHPAEGLLLHFPAVRYMDRWSYGEDRFNLLRVGTSDRTIGPGRLSIQGMSIALQRDPGRVRLIVGRSGGSAGRVGVGWELWVGAEYGNAVSSMAGIPKSGNLQWADGDVSDREIAFQLPPAGTDKDKSRVVELRVALAAPTGGAMVDPVSTTVVVLDGEQVEEQSGGGALGLPGLLALLGMACALRRRGPQLSG